jgi:hypothetical protein
MGTSLPSQQRRLVNDERQSRSGATGTSSDTALSVHRTGRGAPRGQVLVFEEWGAIPRGQQGAWDGGAAEASYVFAGTERGKEKY